MKNLENKNDLLRAIAAVALGALILLIPVMLNGFPFMFQDSADYIIFTPRLFRSPFYGLFIFFFHMNRFIWLPVVAQALISSHLVYLLLKIYAPRSTIWHFIGIIVFLTAVTALPISIGFIMPDIFTPIFFILIFLIGFHFLDFGWPMRIYLLLLASVAISAHLSHLVMAMAIVWVMIPLLRWYGFSWKKTAQRFAILLIPIILTLGAYLSYDTLVFNKFSLFPAGQSFLLANLIEYGPARTYLKQACPQAGYKICPYVNQLQETADTFLWEKGVFDKLGGFEGMTDESTEIVHSTIATHPSDFARMIFWNFARALITHGPTEEISPQFSPWSTIFGEIEKKFGTQTVDEFRNSLQMRGAYPHALFRLIDYFITTVSFLGLIAFAVHAAKKGRRDLVCLAIFMLCAVFGDTLICSAISGVHPRYQARIAWLMPFTVYLMFLALQMPLGKPPKRA